VIVLIKDIEDIERVKSDIYGYLDGGRKSPKKRAHEFVELLEDVGDLDSEFHCKEISKEYHDVQQRYQAFCRAYIEHIFEKFTASDEDAEIMKVAFNYFPKYERIERIVSRRALYAREYYEPRHSRGWGPKDADKSRGLFDEEKRIMEELSNVLAELVVKQGGKLDLIKEVLAILEPPVEKPDPERIANKTDNQAEDALPVEDGYGTQSVDLSPSPNPEPEPDPTPVLAPGPELDSEPASGPGPSRQNKKALCFIVSLCIIVVLAVVFVPHILDGSGNATTPGATSKSASNSTLTTLEAPSDNVDAEQGIPVSLTKEGKKITDEEMAEVINEAKAPIIVYNESGGYNTEEMRNLVLERIAKNPIYGDMVARGLREADSLRDGRIQEENPWLPEFIEKTDKAMENPEQYQEGMRRWLSKVYKTISPTDEYKDYADKIYNILTGFFVDGVYNLKASNRRYVETEGDGIYTRAVEDSEPGTQTAIVLWQRGVNGRYGCIIGFCIDDGSLVICDPLNLDFESFIDE